MPTKIHFGGTEKPLRVEEAIDSVEALLTTTPDKPVPLTSANGTRVLVNWGSVSYVEDVSEPGPE